MGLGAELEELVARPTFALSDEELLARLDSAFTVLNRAAGEVVTTLRELDGRGLPGLVGASSTRAWLRDRQRISSPASAQLVRLAAGVDGTATGDALRIGGINAEQAAVIAHAVAQVPVEQRAAGEALLLRQAATFGPRELARLGERLVELLDPEGAEAAEADRLAKAEVRAYSGRDLHLTDVGEARTRVTGWLDREGAAVVRAALDPLCGPRTAMPTGGLDGRSATQRRADALVDICRRSLSGGELPDNGGDRPQVAITIHWEALRKQVGAATLDDGQPLSPAAARRLACDAALLPAVLGGAGQPLDVGRERRLFTGPLRRAVLLRDRGCAFPDCDRPPRWVEIHHLRHWVDGGPTSLDNAVAACGHHHRVIHRGGWQVVINPQDGHPDFHPPAHLGIAGPLRNKYHLRR